MIVNICSISIILFCCLFHQKIYNLVKNVDSLNINLNPVGNCGVEENFFKLEIEGVIVFLASFPARNSDCGMADGQIEVKRPDDQKKTRALHGLSRSLLNNMVVGVTDGFEKKLEVNGVGYRAAKNGKTLSLTLGYSHPVELVDPEGIETVVEGQVITVKGIDKEAVGQHAAIIREKRAPEPYKGKGIKYSDEVIRRKVGKTGKK